MLIGLLGLGLALGAFSVPMDAKSPTKAKALEHKKSDDMKGRLEGVNSFGKDMMKVLMEEKGDDENVLMSPITIHLLMSMLYLGSPDKSSTFKQLAKGLHLKSGEQEKLEKYRNIMDHYDKISSDKTSNILRLAGTMFLKDGFTLKDDFKSFMKKYFSASSQSFKTPDEGTTMVNEWADEKTNGLISDIFKKGDITKATMLVLASACYFKSDWQHQFKKHDTRPMNFTLTNRDKLKIERGMQNTETFRYAKTNDFKVVELPYKNKDFNMYIALPKKKSAKALNKVAAEFDHSQFKDLLKETLVKLRMPAFDASSEIDLKKPLMALGIKDAFKNAANFSKMTDKAVKVDKAKTKTIVKVDEEGTEAAAVAMSGMMLMSGIMHIKTPIPFIVNRPFVFMIHDDRFDVPLFLGRVVNPQ